MNPHEGAVLLVHAGRTATLRFTWGVIASIQKDWGDEYAQRLGAAVDQRKVADLAELIARASGTTSGDVNAWSPPILEAVKAVSDAWACAWLGADHTIKPKEGDEANPLPAPSMWSRLLSRARYVLASAGPNSGTAPHTPPAA